MAVSPSGQFPHAKIAMAAQATGASFLGAISPAARAISLQHFGEQRLNRVRPKLVACGVRVELVGHDREGDFAVLADEGGVDVEVADVFAVVEFGELDVDGVDDLGAARGVGDGGVGDDSLRIFAGATGEDGEEEDLGPGDFRADQFDDFFVGWCCWCRA